MRNSGWWDETGELGGTPANLAPDLGEIIQGNQEVGDPYGIRTRISAVKGESSTISTCRPTLTGKTPRIRFNGLAARWDAPLTDDEVAELDSYGRLTAFTPLTSRALDLWEREILFGRQTPRPGPFDGILRRIDNEPAR